MAAQSQHRKIKTESCHFTIMKEHIRVRRAKALGIYHLQAPIGWEEEKPAVKKEPVVVEKTIVVESKKASKKETKKSKTSKKLKKQKK